MYYAYLIHYVISCYHFGNKYGYFIFVMQVFYENDFDCIQHIFMSNDCMAKENIKYTYILKTAEQKPDKAIVSRVISKCISQQSHLIHLVPDGVEVLLDHLTFKGFTSDLDLDIRVTLALHHPTHQIVFRNQVLTLHEVDTQHTLQEQ